MTSFVPKGQMTLIAENSEKAPVVEEEIKEAFAFAEESPFPDASELYTDVFREVNNRGA